MAASRTREVDFSAKRRTPHLGTKIPPTVETPTLLLCLAALFVFLVTVVGYDALRFAMKMWLSGEK